MKAIASYTNGFNAALRSIRMILLIYAGYLVIALLLAIPFFGMFRAASGNSELPGSLLQGFDATAIRELLVNGGGLFRFYLNAVLPWMVAFLLFQVFLGGGIFYWVSNPRGKFSISEFNRHSIRYFWRFLKLTVYMLVVHVVISLVLYVPYVLVTGARTGLTDEQVVRPLLFLAGFHLLLLIFLFLLADVAKSRIFLLDTPKVLKTLFRCFKIAVKHFLSFFLLGFLLVLAPAAVYILFYLFRSPAIAGSFGSILLIFVMQQVMIAIQVTLKVWRQASAYRYHLDITTTSP
jgi:hypothetical protein